MLSLWVTYKTGFGLYDWVYCTLYIHTTRDYRQYGAIAIIHTFQFTVTHALGFSVFTSRLLAKDLSQSHCNFKSHMKSSGHSLISFLPLFSTQFNSIQFFCFQAHILAGWRPETRLFTSTRLLCLLPSSDCVLFQPFGKNFTENTASIVKEACSLIRCLAMDIHVTIRILE
jgi:hypothetical protein